MSPMSPSNEKDAPTAGPPSAASHGVASSFATSGHRVVARDATVPAQSPPISTCGTVGGAAALAMMLAALAATISGWVETLRWRDAEGSSVLWPLALTGSGIAGTIAAARLLGSLTGH